MTVFAVLLIAQVAPAFIEGSSIQFVYPRLRNFKTLHHPLLHSTAKKNSPTTSSNTAVQNHHHSGRGSLFRIIPVTLYGRERSITTFAFLDDGSSITLVEDSLVDYLGIEGKVDNLCLTWTANVTRSEELSKLVSLDISGVAQQKKFTIAEARTVRNLGLPKQTMCYEEFVELYPYLAGIPIQDYEDAVPRILIGNDNAHLSVTLKMRERKMDEPIATKTRLGWSIHGPTATVEKKRCFSMHMCQCASNDESLHELVKQYFSLDNMGVSVKRNVESDEDQRARRILQNTTQRVGFRFEIGLLWKYDNFEFPDSYFMAVRRLECLERRMKANPELCVGVNKQIEEYKRKGYIVKVTEEDLITADPRKVWYLPLGVVINLKKPGKIRIFCDTAAEVDGVSLNTMLIKGPDLLVPLKSVLTGFRERRVAVCADVKEMFHQMVMRRADRQSQRILLRQNPNQELQVYFMNVATFGSASSPCSAQFVKNPNASEYADQYPDASDAIIRKHYVDDYLDSMGSEEETIRRAKEVRVPRCYFPGQSSTKFKNIQLHMFVDASVAAFACVAYLRGEVAGQIQCALVTGKAKVAPLKLMYVPRLELQAAVLGARLVESICSTHTLPITKRFIWTDSKTVLGWINSDQRRYRQFEAFSIGEILEKTKANEWHWVPSDSNASDDATKWKRGQNLCPEGRWFGGPNFLHLSEEYWPSTPEEKDDTTEEQQSSMVMHHFIIDSVFDWERFSNWNRLTRTVWFVVRYLGNLRAIARRLPTTKGPLSQEELAKAEAWIFHSTQKEIFAKEVTMMSTVHTTGKSKLLHGNMETVINELRQRFHVSNLRTVVRGAVKECLQCNVSKAVPSVPRMSRLPAARLGAFFRPFTFVGLDYFGPMTVRVGRNNVKRWVALFTCLSIRAVHLEVVHSLSTESCKMAVRRFVARHGSPSEIYSDNATNFLDASNELRNAKRGYKHPPECCEDRCATELSDCWSMIKTAINSVAENILGHMERKRRFEWFDECQQVLYEKNAARELMMRQTTRQNVERYRQKRRQQT
ncbi:uncharacterized protein LOC129766622 [Toxorhynchites rutilus septentrionalis]|uniref:uncharacterized protein LOC129766622 n=1 Tax=Toxorhynchites rutilus septentrionalis TaxID=329112 RepID=UPI002478B8F9|nr:uncharacterized protein LOC129766622 [Toxorhynchites rutilus septentrionalis]